MSSVYNRATAARGQNQPRPEAKATEQEQAETKVETPRTRIEKRRMTFREAAQRTKLDVRLNPADRKEFVHRWVNGDPGRVQELRERGYEIVDDPYIPDDRGTERRVGRTEAGGTLKARLMRVPREFYEEDLREKREVRQEQIQSVTRNKGVSSEAAAEGIRADELTIKS